MAEEKTRKYQIYDKQTKTWFKVSPDDYTQYYRWCAKIRKREQGLHRCFCPKAKWWLCDGMCDDCEYYNKFRVVSLTSPFEKYDNEELFLMDVIGDERTGPSETALSKVMAEMFLKRLAELVPEAEQIGRLRMLGFTDDAIAKSIGLNRTTFRSRLEAARKKLSEEFGDDFCF